MSLPNAYEFACAPVEILGALFIYAGGYASHDHYTWWSLALVTLYVAVVFAAGMRSAYAQGKPERVAELAARFDRGAESVRARFWVAPFTSALVVVLGVITMSAMPCSLLRELYVENGPLTYTAGNFAVHYWPLCRMVLFAPVTARLDGPKPLFFVTHLILIYTLCFSPNEIYGCSALPAVVTTVILGLIPTLALVLWLFVASHV